MYDYLYINLGLNSICFAFFRKRNASIRGVSSNLFCYTYKEQTDAHEHTDSHYNNFVHPPKNMRIFFLLLSQTMYDFPVLEYGHCENSIILFINYNWIITNFNLQMLFPKSNIEIQASRLFYIASV